MPMFPLVTSPALSPKRLPLFSVLALSIVWSTASAASEADQAKQLDTVTVTGVRIDDAEGGRIGMKMDVPLREVPQSISVVTLEQMNERGVQTIEQALRYSAGLTVPWGNDARYDWMFIRGFDALYDTYRDGLSQIGGDYTIPRLDAYAFERVEVLKGPSGVMYGAGSPGGLINLVSKRPREDIDSEIAASIGAYDRRELRGDLSGSLGGGWLYRIVGAASDSEGEIDFEHNKRYLLMPSLHWSNEDTSLELQATGQRLKLTAPGTSATLSPTLLRQLRAKGYEQEIERDLYLGEPGFDRYDADYGSFAWTFEHRFNDIWSLRQNARYQRMSLDYTLHYLGDFNEEKKPEEAPRSNMIVDEGARSLLVDTSVQARVDGERVDHTVMLGFDYRKLRNNENDGFGSGMDIKSINLFDPIYGSPVTLPTQTRRITDARQAGVYLQDHIKFDQRWVLLLGGRYDKVRREIDSQGQVGNFDDEAFSGRAGLVYVGEGGFAPYFSYSESFQPLNSNDAATNRPFKPETGRQFELGARWQPTGSEVLISASLFDLRKQNMVITDVRDPNLKHQVGDVRSRGFEAEANTRIADGTQLTAAYTYLDTEVLSGDASQPTGSRLPGIPKQSVSLYVSHDISGGILHGLDVGAGVRYVGGTVSVAGERDVRTPGYALIDAGIHYPWGNWTFSLTGSNLADREYETNCNLTLCYRGYGRRLDLGASYQW